MKVTSLRYLDAKFHHPSLGASSPNMGNRISCVQNSRKTENRNSVNNSGIGILCCKNSNERLAFPAVAGLLVLLSAPGAPFPFPSPLTTSVCCKLSHRGPGQSAGLKRIQVYFEPLKRVWLQRF